MRLFLTLLLCLVGLDLQAQALWRNFFTTNQTPIVDVVAGSNATVVATTPNVFTRRFTVSSTATGGGGTIYGSNVVGTVGSATNATYVTTPILTNAVTNFTITSAMVTNVLPAVLTNNTTGNAGTATYVTTAILTNQVYGSNVSGAVSEAAHSTNADSATYAGTATNATFVLTSTLTNQVYASNVVSGGIIPIGGVATNNPWDGAFLKGATGTRYWSQDGATLTNVPFSIFTNYAANPTAFTNVNGFGFAMDTYGMTSWWEHAVVASVGPVEIIHTGIDTNAVITTNGGRFFGSILSLAPSASSPSSNELVTASWVRNIFNVGAAYYNSAVIETGATNIDSPDQFVYRYQSTIPASSIRTYTTANYLTNNGYVGAVVTTNTFSSLAGAIVVNAYLAYTGGSSTPTLTIKPEIYISTDRTNWYGEIAGAPQNIVYGTTNLYQWLVDYPATVATNAGGFYVQRRLKVGTVTGAGTRTLTVFIGTNAVSGPLDAAHLTMQGPSATAGNAYLQNNQTWTGTNAWTQPMYGNGSGLSNVLSTVAPINDLAAISVSVITNWEYLSKERIVISENFRGSSSDARVVTQTGQGGATGNLIAGPSGTLSTGWFRFGCYPTNTGSYAAMRMVSTGVTWTTNFLWDSDVIVSGYEQVEISIGALNTASGLTTSDRLQWMANTNWSANWIAVATANSSSSYWTSSAPVTINGRIRLSIYAPSTNSAVFYTNGLAAYTMTTSLPGGRAITPCVRTYALVNSGTAAVQYSYLDWLWTIFE